MMEPLRGADPARIAGHRLLRRLGAGGMGVVYLARSGGGSLVAVKVIRAAHADDPGFRARFRREVETAGRVANPWVVPLLDADPDAESPWLATAFVPGPSLAEAVEECGPLPYRSAEPVGLVGGLSGPAAGRLDVPGGEGRGRERVELTRTDRRLQQGQSGAAAGRRDGLLGAMRVTADEGGVPEHAPGQRRPPAPAAAGRGGGLLTGGQGASVAQRSGQQQHQRLDGKGEAQKVVAARGPGDGLRLLGGLQRRRQSAGGEVDEGPARQQMRQDVELSGAAGDAQPPGDVPLGIGVALQQGFRPGQPDQRLAQTGDAGIGQRVRE